ncbi:MAG: glycosyltransferase, partial [Chloroflexota bacterium]
IGGAEDVLEVLVDLFPDAPVFTTIYGPEQMPQHYRTWDIRASWLNQAPGIHQHHQPYLPLYPAAVRSLDFRGYDLILSNKSGFIHGLKKSPQQLHLCYCLAPTRYVWDYQSYAAREKLSAAAGFVLKPVINRLRQWDYQAAQRVDHFCAISTEIQERIRRMYDRDSIIITPPVDTDRFQPVSEPREDYYFIVSRLIPYKRIDLAIQAFNQMGKRLIIAGDGRDRSALEALAGPTVELRGFLPWEEIIELMAHCKAFIFPGFEDFGIAPVQAQAAGRPVIAFAAGGALDTVIDQETGTFFHQQTVADLTKAVQTFEQMTFDSQHIRQNAERFSVSRFRKSVQEWVEQQWQAKMDDQRQ